MIDSDDGVAVPSETSSASWDSAADWWKTRTDSSDPYREYVHGPALLTACGDVTVVTLDVNGKQVLDVGCGSGYFSRELARAGADVQAFDYSGNLVELASAEERSNPLGIGYRQLDAALVGETFKSDDSGSFDVVTGCMSIADIESLDTALAGIQSVLKPEGRFCFSLPHPFASPPENRWDPNLGEGTGGRSFTRYFGRRRVSSGLNNVANKPDGPEIQLWHLTISGWHDLLVEKSFKVENLIEPYPTLEQVAENPGLARIAEIPEFLIIVARSTRTSPLG